MLAFDSQVALPGHTGSRGDAIRYAAQRLAELLDPGAHLSQSAVFHPSPRALAAELIDGTTAHLDGRGVSERSIIDRATDYYDLFDRSERYVSRFYPSTAVPLMTALSAVSASSTNPRTLTPKVEALRTAAVAIQTSIVNGSDGRLAYKFELLEQIRGALLDENSSDPHFKRLDRDLSAVAAMLLDEGRSGVETSRAAARALHDASTDAEAVESWCASLEQSERTFAVVLVLEGTTRVPRAAEYGCEWIGDVGSATWGNASKTADSKLRRFVEKRKTGHKRCAIRVATPAWDFEDAHSRARSLVSVLRDRLVAAHRTSTFSLLDEALVCDLTTDMVAVVPTDEVPGPSEAHPLVGADSEELRSSLRYGGLARIESLPVVATMHSWIALECLAAGAPSSAARFLPRKLAAITTLTAVSNLWPRSWEIAWRTGRAITPERWAALEQWLEVKGGPSLLPDRQRWGVLLVLAHYPETGVGELNAGPHDDSAAALLREVLLDWPPYSRARLAQTAELLANGSRLIDWASRVTDRAHANANRIQLMRHRAVHTALYEVTGDKQLALAAQQMLDAVYEVLPNWLSEDLRPWEGIRDAASHKRYLFRLWKKPIAAGQRVPWATNPRRITQR